MEFLIKGKKRNYKELSNEPFTGSGMYDDEVTLVFGERKLFVSKNFLCMSSPVFEAMFTHNFMEKKQKRVNMTGKSYDDFLDILRCIHPRIQQPIQVTNVMGILVLAEEYDVTSVKEKCKTVMKSILSDAVEIARGKTSNLIYHIRPLRSCFLVLRYAVPYDYTDVVTLAIETIVKFGYCLYNGEDPMTLYELTDKPDGKNKTYAELRNDCCEEFRNLPAEVRCRILSARLTLVDNGKFK